MNPTPFDPVARLRECPHCGGIAKICETKVDFPTGSASAWRIWCDTPFCAMGMNSATREQCVTAWNRRAAHDTAQPGATYIPVTQAERAANALLCDMIGNREWDVKCAAQHIEKYTAQPGAGCDCKSANNPNGTTDAAIFRPANGKPYAVDACIAPVIAELHKLGMPTRASCCGHGVQPPSVIMETDMDHYDCLRLLSRIDHRLWSVERVRP